MGGFSVFDAAGAEPALPARKARALLAYLALAPAQWHRRERLAGLLWSDRPEALARNSLRQALASIRKLGAVLGIDVVETDGDRVRLAEGVAEIDAVEFQKLHESDPLAAAGLYAGELLDGFTVRDPAFQDWLAGARAALNELTSETLERAGVQAECDGNPRIAIDLARQLIAVNPYCESGHRRLMELHAMSGNRAEAIRQYQSCERLLRDELGVAPCAETTALLERIRGEAGAAEIHHPRLADRPSIAVLPFENLSADKEQEYFADGMAEDIISALSRFRWLFVIARNSTFTYKGQAVDVRRVAHELGVRYVLEGSIRRVADRIRVTAQLIDALTGKHVWSERYNRRIEDLFAVQDAITETLVGAMAPEIDAAERLRAERYTPDSVDTWVMFQKGLAAYYETTEASLRLAVETFDHVCRRDPRFAQARAFAADTRLRQSIHFDVQRKSELLAVASRLGREARELDSRDSLGFSVEARVISHQGDHEQAIRLAEEGIALNPNDWMARYALGYVLIVAGRFEAGLDALDDAQRMSPHSAFSAGVLSMRAGALVALRRFDEAAIVAERGIEAAHPRPSTFLYLAAVYALLGHIDRACAVIRKLQQHHPHYATLCLTHERVNTGSLAWQAVGETLLEGLRLCGMGAAGVQVGVGEPE
jgi:TolB-like protein